MADVFGTMRRRWRALVRAGVTLFLYDVFISYARRDGRRYARALHRHLESNGIVCFLDRNDVLAGDLLTPTLARALKKSRLLIVVATDGASRSSHVQLEVQTYLQKRRPVVPVDFSGSYTRGEWPLLKPLNPVWLDELPAALESRPSPEVLRGIRQHLKSAGSRVFAQRLVAFIVVVVAALGAAAWWSARRASDQERQREAEQLSARAAIAFDVDYNPLRALAYGVASASRYASLEAGQVLGRVLPFARRPLSGYKIGRLASRVRYSAGGRYLLTVGRLDEPRDVLTILEASTMKEIWRTERVAVAAAVISPDERWLVLSGASACVAIVQIENGRTMSCLPHDGVTRAEFSADGKLLMTTGRWSGGQATDSVRVWASEAWQAVGELPVQAGIWSAAISRNGGYVALGLKATRPDAPIACLWELQGAPDCRAAAVLDQPLSSGRLWESADVQFSDDSQLLLLGQRSRLTVLEVASGHERHRLVDSTGFRHVRFSPSGQALLAASNTGLISLFPARPNVSPTIAQLPHPASVVAAEFTPDGRAIITAGDDGIVRVWDAGLAQEDFNDFFQSTRLTGITTHGANLTSFIRSRAQSIGGISTAPDGRSFATAGSDGWVRVWNVEPEPDVDWSRHGQGVTAVAATPGGGRVITAGEFSGRVWELDPLRVMARLRRHGNDLTGAAMSRDGRVIMTAGSEGTVFLFDGQDLHLAHEIVHEPGAERLVRAALAADGSMVATTSSDRIVKLWRARDATFVSQHRFEAPVEALALSAAGDALAVASGGAITVWQTGVEWRDRVHISVSSPVRALQFGETRLAAGSEDGAVSLWNATTGQHVWTARQAGRVGAVDISVDGSLVASGAHDRTVRIWDASSGAELGRLSFPFRVEAVTFARGGTRIVAGGENYVHVSPWRVDDLRDIACRHLSIVDAPSWARLVGDVDTSVCRAGEGR